MATLTDIQGYRPAAGSTRRQLGSVAHATWHAAGAGAFAMAAISATPMPRTNPVKRSNGTTSRPSEAPT